eukprot:scaffold20224_cov53-Attheya_sp.AAC.1
MYKDLVVIFKTGSETRDIPYGIGVKQGDNMVPIEIKSKTNKIHHEGETSKNAMHNKQYFDRGIAEVVPSATAGCAHFIVAL